LIGLFRDFSFPGDFKMVSVDLNILLERALLASGFASQSKLKIRKNLDLELKPVICSEAGMYEVFLNLIVNAIYAVEDMDGGDNGVIEVTTRQVDDAVEISIFDNGAGIPMEIQDKVFSPFFTTKASPQFAGNGLAIVYDQVVVRHGGQVSCQSLEGEGTTMVVALPLSRN
ncbi:MAG: ATP-binding protein, partial [Thermodesulfobacteriota bacterium]|nr:ATP-binding protein [Thermodesulfobacteriota bacterium]